MKQQIKLSVATAQLVALAYQGMSAAREYARDIASDPNVPGEVRNDFQHIAANLSIPIARIEKRIPKEVWEVFNSQIKNNDHVRLDNINALYVRMIPAQQEMVETFMEGLLRNEIAEFI